MNLSDLWFVLIAVLFSGYFFFEGFDFGVGMLLPVLGRSNQDRRMMLNSIGPVWDANEVWLLTAGGAMFAAFPGWYATMFSGFYLALFLVLALLIVRGVAFEFRGKVESAAWRKVWDTGIVLGSVLPPLLVAVALANLIKGVPIDAAGQFVGTFFSLLSVPTVVAGLAAVAVFLYHGAVYLTLKQDDELKDGAWRCSKVSGAVALALAVATAVLAALTTDAFNSPLSLILAAVSLLSLALSWLMAWHKRSGIAMALNGLSIVGAVAALFAGLFPRVMVSSLNADYSLTIAAVSSSPYTLNVMTVVALTVLPIVLGYSAWTYWVFRKRMKTADLEY